MIKQLFKYIRITSKSETLFSLALLMLCILPGYGKDHNTKNLLSKADSAYKENKYKTAIKYYKKLDKEYISASLYYNLGNCFFKRKNYGKAIAYYEKAKKLNPYDEDISFNLELANQRQTDKIEGSLENNFVKNYQYFLSLGSMEFWPIMSLQLMLLAAILFIMFVISKKLLLKRIGLYGAIFFLLFSICCIFLSSAYYNYLNTHDKAIITSDKVNVKNGPSQQQKNAFILHEGTKVEVLNKEGQWFEIKIADGNVGWAKSKSFMRI
ncbi:MAG: tetratricopeptide repeat protein [Flavobacteriales bacterium]